ncbi:MAG TPA: GNAT family N-acetyltransferase [Gemmatimonadales bacterium]|nr:GNAT family N-acetyltransferase [Gemmatimonadales bacterium]
MRSPHRLDVAALETARLRLRRMVPDDLPELRRLHADPRVMATLGGVWSGDESRVFLERAMTDWHAGGIGWWRADDRATGRFAGRGGLRCIVLDGRDELELGYALAAECWGRGLATDAGLPHVLYRITRDAWQRRV